MRKQKGRRKIIMIRKTLTYDETEREEEEKEGIILLSFSACYPFF